ncbi:hypothetical protein PH210_03300 [Paenibacillus sp. BSR1-1]|uniref:hypothetical protein n=1 Tax=Paenibacillus sp. BSR1-1 TaxID=3020845 RepID=UPI0025AF196A|nr:hypothetical protein [Paenibacillus sp. BSR1-1]MDN3015233.1 hypothetical protein [Paenibacillus sp. BSR1-1]
MKGIYFINDRISLNGLSMDESKRLQEQSIKNYIQQQKIEIVPLNPYQLNDYYTIPHALLYDLKKEKQAFDCLIHYSNLVLEDFIYSYPAKWLILKSYFTDIIQVENRNDVNIQIVI